MIQPLYRQGQSLLKTERTKLACEGVKKYFTPLVKPETNLVCQQLAKVISHNDIEFGLFLNISLVQCFLTFLDTACTILASKTQ